MLRIKQITLCLLAVFALSAIAASAASAASPLWWVAGSPLKAGATLALAETTTVSTPFIIEAESVGYGVKCESIQLEKSFIEGEKTAKTVIVFKSCKDLTQKNCAVATITTNPLTATLEGTTEKFRLNFKPTSGTEVTTVHFSGSECSFPSIVIDGTMACNYPNVETEKFSHELEFTKSSGSNLETTIIVPTKVKMTGIDKFWLASEKNWAVR